MYDTMSSSDMDCFDNSYEKSLNAIESKNITLEEVEDEYKTYELVSEAVNNYPSDIFHIDEDLLSDREINNLAETAYQADSDIIVEMFYDKSILLTKTGSYLKQYMQKFLIEYKSIYC